MPNLTEERAALLAVSRYGADMAKVRQIVQAVLRSRRDGKAADLLESLLLEKILSAAQVQELLRVFLQQQAGVRQYAVARRAVKQRFADFAFELANRLADRRLRAVELFGGARKAAFARHRQKDFQLK